MGGLFFFHFRLKGEETKSNSSNRVDEQRALASSVMGQRHKLGSSALFAN